jgi:hypothetical protein
MDKFSGLFIKTSGEWGLHGKLDSDVDGKIKALRELTVANGKLKVGQKNLQVEQACVFTALKERRTSGILTNATRRLQRRLG